HVTVSISREHVDQRDNDHGSARCRLNFRLPPGSCSSFVTPEKPSAGSSRPASRRTRGFSIPCTASNPHMTNTPSGGVSLRRCAAQTCVINCANLVRGMIQLKARCPAKQSWISHSSEVCHRITLRRSPAFSQRIQLCRILAGSPYGKALIFVRL